MSTAKQRAALLDRIGRLAASAVQGSLAEVYVRCGSPSCPCHRDPEKRHGPHLYLKYKDPRGHSTGMYVPREHEAQMRRAVQAWAELRKSIVAVAQLNRVQLHERLRRRRDVPAGR
jgi:hypothetical protein